MNVEQRIELLILDHLGQPDSVDRVLSSLTIEELRDALRPVVTRRIQIIEANKRAQEMSSVPLRRRAVVAPSDVSQTRERAFTRNVENEALRMRREATTMAQKSASYIMLGSKTFVTHDGREVPWLDATIDDHESRLILIGKQVSGLTDRLDHHRFAIKDITSVEGAETLHDVANAVAEVAA